ncbi:MAG: SsrA-binding protein SmpB [Gammaproteobacteria bacterium]|nr:SsrA-binding protein SmpB [Gammaproteobacteria bacterium]
MKRKTNPATIARNKKARFDYHIEERFEAGLVLEGWELKSVRAGQVQLTEAYVSVTNGEAFLQNVHIAPLTSCSTHITPVPNRARKLLLHAKEISRIFRTIREKGRSCVALSMYWKGPFVKCEIATVLGKKKFDKRRSIRDRDYQRDLEQSFRTGH